MPSLKEALAAKIPVFKNDVKETVAAHGSKSLGECSVEQAYGGMRSLKCMVTETSAVDPNEGIRYRGMTIPEMQKKLPKAKGGEQPLPEGVIWLLLTGEIPNEEQAESVRRVWRSQEELPTTLARPQVRTSALLRRDGRSEFYVLDGWSVRRLR